MAKVTVEVTQPFTHGAINASTNDELVMEESLARDLKQFVRVKDSAKMMDSPRNKMQPDSLAHPPGEARAAGAVQASSSSPAAQASHKPMSNKSDDGERPGKKAKKGH